MVKIEVNGEWREVDPGPDDTAVELLRDGLGLTGTKLVCGGGVCGACTVQVDGEPVVSCLLPVAALEGRSVATVEGLTRDGHPVARAFAAHAALQCGFCTPGFVVEAVAFHDTWRAEHGTAEPPAEDVAAALAGHLCRCGAYAEIQAAVRDACVGKFDEPGEMSGPRREAPDKITGAARYTVDIRHDGQLEGVLLRSPHAHARVGAVDVSGALALEGVHAAVELLAEDRTVRYAGQEVAAVAAVDRRTAEAALAKIVVEYEPLPAVIGMDQAQVDGAPTVYQKRNRKPPNAAEGATTPAPWKGNVRGPMGVFSTHRRRARNLIERARAAGDSLLFEGEFRTQAQAHTTLEPHAAVARFTGDTLEVHVSTQAVAEMAKLLAKRFSLPEGKVRVIAEHVGGGFGSKAGVHAETVAAVTLAKAADAPVRVAFDRQAELSVTGHRPAARISLSLLADRDANLAAVRIHAHADAGVAIGSMIAALGRLMYPAPAKELVDYDVVNHTPYGLPFRAPGAPPLSFALEQAVDEAARRLGRDPIALRQKWDPDPGRQRLYRWAAELPVWQQDSRRTGRFRRGVGVAAANWLYIWESDCAVALSVRNGRLTVSTAVQDMGTGSRSVLAATVAAHLGLEPSDVDVALGDSALPTGPGSGGSRTTATIAPAALAAVTKLKAELVTRSGLAGAQADAGGIRYAGGVLPWSEVIAGTDDLRVEAKRPPDHSVLSRSAPRAMAGAGVLGALFPVMMRLQGPLRIGRGYPGGVQVVEVEVDTKLGRTRVLRVHGGIAAGKLAVPELAAAQARGGIIQGVGFALYEERQFDLDTGLVLSANLEDYRIPGIADMPEIELHFDTEGYEHVPGGGVGLGEVATIPVAAAIANAVYDATGVRQYELPLRPDRVLLGGEAT